jgi:hypothetical protein
VRARKKIFEEARVIRKDEHPRAAKRGERVREQARESSSNSLAPILKPTNFTKGDSLSHHSARPKRRFARFSSLVRASKRSRRSSVRRFSLARASRHHPKGGGRERRFSFFCCAGAIRHARKNKKKNLPGGSRFYARGKNIYVHLLTPSFVFCSNP